MLYFMKPVTRVQHWQLWVVYIDFLFYVEVGATIIGSESVTVEMKWHDNNKNSHYNQSWNN